MKVCVIPLDIIDDNKEANILAIAHELHQVEHDTDLVILPELFTTAFVADKDKVKTFAETNDGTTVSTLKRWSNLFGFAIAGSFLATDGKGDYFNRAFLIEPMGDTTFYDKRHLFPLSEENKTYKPGHAPSPIIRFRGWNIKLIVCFDLRFPVWCKNNPDQLYDLLIVPSNWPKAREYQYKILLAARAIENQAYVIGANRTGIDKYGDYPAGISTIFDNFGNPILETRSNGHIYSILNRDNLTKGRERFPVYKASDRFTIEY